MTAAEPNALQPVSTPPTPALIAGQLRARVVDGTFPPGTQLTEAYPSERLGVSRGPVREALQRLIQEGLLVNVRSCGVFVVEFGPDDVADIYAARGAIERHAAASLRRGGDQRTIDALESIVDEMAEVAGGGWVRLADLDLTFHETLVAGAASPRLTRMFGTLLAETRICLASLAEAHPRPRALGRA